ncbi:hypothetical protein [Komagataeibacter saccharivorans]|uniref:hypothetical protein n=1 Tax=Komagataeibacter saccharivorans TaxID=265959 RepID=UPI0039E95F63
MSPEITRNPTDLRAFCIEQAVRAAPKTSFGNNDVRQIITAAAGFEDFIKNGLPTSISIDGPAGAFSIKLNHKSDIR